ncbi:pyruvate kinase [Patescibacteria group bacterium]|nr:pyruvate kinase [Patescibacteria group bacterium]MCG2702742.1 pyruvate kinase [Candidatus Parcubacteria bacterium]MBU4209956.1 pyruvate kinase [Patescibacteria group bacterium]MBU4265442.1 pyruvate kinase [Patescibacteria group bacterium]MBU4390492.1 pyruvate kinase [Patescibacteria group bacterium]
MKTKIIATIGPATLNKDIFNRLIDAGVDYIRINSAYGDYNQYDQILNNLKNHPRAKQIKTIFDIKSPTVLDYFTKNKLDIIAISFTESANQIKKIKQLAPKSQIISKIESKNGLKNFCQILPETWGVMVARGDLEKAVSLEKVPCLQKGICQQAIAQNKFLVVATEMLLTMVNEDNPTLAEASDIANAIFDKVSAVMLSEETAIGKYPTKSVQWMKKIVKSTEECVYDSCSLISW